MNIIGLTNLQVTRSVVKKQKRLDEKAKRLVGVKLSPQKLQSDLRKLRQGFAPESDKNVMKAILTGKTAINPGSYKKNTPYKNQPMEAIKLPAHFIAEEIEWREEALALMTNLDQFCTLLKEDEEAEGSSSK